MSHCRYGVPSTAVHGAESCCSIAGTEKVRQAQECGRPHVVNPDWLWSCLERWEKVDEQLFPLSDDCGKAQR